MINFIHKRKPAPNVHVATVAAAAEEGAINGNGSSNGNNGVENGHNAVEATITRTRTL